MIAGRGDGSGDAADGSAGDDTAAQAALAQAEAEQAARVEAADAALDAAQTYLDELNAQLDALQEQCEAAEEAEAEARERVRDLQRDETEARNYVQTATQEQTAARQWAAEAATAETQAVAQEQLAIDWDTQARYDLAHFGEGRGWETGFEFDNWHASWQPRVVGETTPRQDGLRGHQLYLPLAAYAAEKHWEFSLSGGWLESRSGRVHGHVSGWTDTALAAVYKNDHPQYDVHYGLGLNVPTGRDNVHQNAMLPEDLARFTSFGTGWNYTPSVTVTRHLTDEDKWTAGVSYTWNGTYDFQLDGMKLSIMQEQDPDDGQWYAPYAELAETQQVRRGHIEPGGELRQNFTYQHSGAQHQWLLDLAHTSYGRTRQTSAVMDIYAPENAASAYYQNHVGAYRGLQVQENYRSGDDWSARWYYRQAEGPKDAFLAYSLLSYTMNTGYYDNGFGLLGQAGVFDTGAATNNSGEDVRRELINGFRLHQQSGVHRFYGGLGWQHACVPQQRLTVLFNYMRSSGIYYSSLRNVVTPGHNRRSVLLRYQWLLGSQQASIAAERYSLRHAGPASERYQGWNVSATWSWSF